MPFVAELDGVRVQAWELSSTRWSQLKTAYRSATLQLSCGNLAVPKTSSQGLQFFAHKAGTECTSHVGADESLEHLQAKLIVAEAAASSGWVATIEYPGPNREWIADVLLERDGRRLAVEVQISKQSAGDFRRRQLRYEAAGVECFWLIGPRNTQVDYGVPHYRISPETGAQTMTLSMSVSEGQENVDLREALSLVLQDSINEWIDPLVTSARIATQMAKCYREQCGKWLTFWYLESVNIETRCGQLASLGVSDYSPHLPQRVEQLIQHEIRRRILASDLASPTTYMQRRTAQVPEGYIGQLCPHCGFIQGDHFISELRFRQRYDIRVQRTDFPLSRRALKRNHYCEDIGRGKCGQRVFAEPAFPSCDTNTYLYVDEASEEHRPLPLPGTRKSRKVVDGRGSLS